jgi:hypothetical protein
MTVPEMPVGADVMGVLAAMTEGEAAGEVGDVLAAALLDGFEADVGDVAVIGALPERTAEALARAGYRVVGETADARSLDALIVADPGAVADPLAVLDHARGVLRAGGRLCLFGLFRRQPVPDGTLSAPLLQTSTALIERGGVALTVQRDLSSQVESWLARFAAEDRPLGDQAQRRAAAAAAEMLARGRDGFYLLLFEMKGAPRWTVTHTGSGDQEALEQLFEEVFGHRQSPAMWAWKYGEGGGHSLIARRDGAVVAHCGGMVRRVSYLGRPRHAIQMCDMMVAPAERGVLTRKGALFQVTATFIELYIGYGRPCLFAMGFPTSRHTQLGERLGLYRSATRMAELAWQPGGGRPHLASRVRELQTDVDGAAVDGLWARMRADLSAAVVVERDWAYVRQRYLAHPQVDYRLFLVSGRLGGTPLGLIVLRFDDQRCELLDFVGPLDAIPLLVSHARRIAGRGGASELFAWVSLGYADRFIGTRPQQRGADLVVPVSAWTPSPSAEELGGRMWLMSGDTDFR